MPLPSGRNPVVQVMIEPERGKVAQLIRENVVAEWHSLSRAARQLAVRSGLAERSVFSV